MGGLFGVVSKENCIDDLFYGTDYHSHLGEEWAGLAVRKSNRFENFAESIKNNYFRPKFEPYLPKLHGNMGIGVISDTDKQPLIVRSHLGTFGIVTVGKINNLNYLVGKAYKKGISFSDRNGVDPTELVGKYLINQEDSFEKGIQSAQEAIKGSCSLLLLTEKGIYAARDKLGRTPIVIGKKQGSYAATLETCAFPNLGFKIDKYLGPGEIIFMTPEGYEQKKKPGSNMQVCPFLFVYYGFPDSNYEGINVEEVRYRCGADLAKNDKKIGIQMDFIAGIPDSGIAYAIGYANEAGIPYKRPFVKYTTTWARSFTPLDQKIRALIAKKKLIPIKELIDGQRIVFCEDSIVRATQLQNTIQILYDNGAKEVHMRPACPPLVYRCKFLNFSMLRSELDLVARRAIESIEGKANVTREKLKEYVNPDSEKHQEMVEIIRNELKLSSLKYQRLENLVKAIGLPKENLCTYCWDGSNYF